MLGKAIANLISTAEKKQAAKDDTVRLRLGLGKQK
jgi:hypothetical protein